MIEIGVIVYGIYTLITGKFTLLGGKKLEGWRGRVTGGILLSYLVIAFFGGIVLALTGNEHILEDRMSLFVFTLVLLFLTIPYDHRCFHRRTPALQWTRSRQNRERNAEQATSKW